MFTQIRTRIISSFVLIALFVSFLFIGLGFVFSYQVEDTFFYFILDSEQQRIETQIAEGQTPTPYFEFVQYIETANELPSPVRELLAAEPNRGEFPGENQAHYHLKHLEQGFLLAEVSDQLIVRKAKGGMFKFSLIIVSFILIMVVFVAWLLARRVTRPINQLHRILGDSSDNELPHGFSKAFKRDEIGTFARALDAAFTKIQTLVKREQDFTRDASHELRTPLAISTGALTLLQGTSLSEEQQQLVSRIFEAQNDMQQSVESLLTMAREESFILSNIKLLPIIEQAVIMHHKIIEHKRVELEISIASGVTVNANSDALKVIISNLISNAFRNTQKGVIKVSFSENKLTIEDTGSGIDPAIMAYIFEQGVKTAQSPGHGFGLAIVKRFCQRLDIAVTVSSDKTGSTFTLDFN